ncbi:hypothetical protein [Flavobacterium sp. HTF]|uniref:hypothetical protein n=1 Tax=Flavobacterium sp. HTF TaxID=2170732 RepID=UPI000D5CDC03|nr:hypothetical protein [Flavobacterium sp. HTF]PWB22561.1 hypothetical protein DCO46_16920 [Flavobacterium sp. HTF]
MKENPFKFFDKILEYLYNNDHKYITFQELTENIFPKSKKEIKFKKIVENIFEETDRQKILANALLHLKSEDLISYNQVKPITDITVRITQKGIVKIKTNSFCKEHNRTVWNHRIDRFNKILTPMIALCAFCLSLYNYFNTNK